MKVPVRDHMLAGVSRGYLIWKLQRDAVQRELRRRFERALAEAISEPKGKKP